MNFKEISPWLEIEFDNDDNFIEYNGVRYFLADFLRFNTPWTGPSPFKDHPNICGLNIDGLSAIELNSSCDGAKLYFLT